MKYKIVRKAVLMEDEGREEDVGEVEADSEEAALLEAEKRFGADYFRSSDFRVARS